MRAIRVKRAELIRAVEGRLRKLDAEHGRSVRRYADDVESYPSTVVASLEKALAAAKRGKLPKSDYRGTLQIVCNPQPEKPSKRSREACNLEWTLKTLKIGAEETVPLSPDDADFYFGPCEAA